MNSIKTFGAPYFNCLSSNNVPKGIVQMDGVINILFIHSSLLKIYQNYSREEFVLTSRPIITYVMTKCWNMKSYIVWFNQVCCKSVNRHAMSAVLWI